MKRWWGKGIVYLNINVSEEGQSVKSESSIRKIPIHSDVLKLGFMTYVESIKKQKEKKLFPSIKPDSHGTWGGRWGKWWGRYTDKHRVKWSKKSFHSFRHTFKQLCRETIADEELRDTLTGHSNQNVGRSYGSGFGIEKLKEAIDKISFDIDIPPWEEQTD